MFKKGFRKSLCHLRLRCQFHMQCHINLNLISLPTPHATASRHDTIFIQQIKKLKVVKTSFMRHKDAGVGTLLSVDEALIKFRQI